MSFLAVPMPQDDPAERRRSVRVPLEMALQIVVKGEAHAVRTVLANRHGLVCYSVKLCVRGSLLEVRNPATGRSTRVRVAWSWVEQVDDAKTIRLALEKTDAGPSAWEQAYEDRLREGSPAVDPS
ncbi:MAG TPA: hypothetical protein VFQ51_01810 [Vicinamibacteria bacterium]|nr:hypothetical protein [Vicinamibacteria bacterium]